QRRAGGVALGHGADPGDRRGSGRAVHESRRRSPLRRRQRHLDERPAARRGAGVAAMSMSEEVMVVETALLAPYLQQGIIHDQAEEILEVIDEKHFFIVRQIAEESPQYRQIIPYVVIRCLHESNVQWFVLRRTRLGTDARLHEKISLGIGGHINPGLD